MKRRLYFFTSSFPYANKESFIENEINYLAQDFHKITIVPLYSYDRHAIKRPTPENCNVLEPIIRKKWLHYLGGLFGIRSIQLYIKEFILLRVYSKAAWIRIFFIDLCATNALLRSNRLKKILKELCKDDVLYFYWGKGASNIIPFISYVKAKKVVRFHRGDLYDYVHGGYIPIQKYILESADELIFISNNGKEYVKRKYPNLLLNSTVSFLGTKDYGISKRSNDNILRLLSCSNVISVKRLPLIYEALQSISNINVEWTHIGQGPDFENFKQVVKHCRSNIKIRLLGRLTYQGVISYYKTNHIDAFINVSSSEGLPVSLMEAISFNVPVIATNVGGTSDLVVPETGILLSSDPTLLEIVNAIEIIRQLKIIPRKFWDQNFNAAVNYPAFIENNLIPK